MSMLIARDDFPAPIATLSVSRIWAYQDVRKWAEDSGRTIHPIVVR